MRTWTPNGQRLSVTVRAGARRRHQSPGPRQKVNWTSGSVPAGGPRGQACSLTGRD